MLQKTLLPLLCLFILSTCARAQTFSGGFRAGLNFLSFSGDTETDLGGNTLESFENTTGFHVGATFALAFTDLVGVKANLMYTQKGTERRFNGPSFFYVYDDDAEDFVRAQNLDATITINNSYLEVPVLGYYRLGPFEIEGGVSAGFLVNSRNSGSLDYQGTEFGGTDLQLFLEGNYITDPSGAAAVQTISEIPIPGAVNQFFPRVIGAYYNSNSAENVFRSLDFALIGGVSYFLNNGLFLGLRYQYGLTDVTDGSNDLRLFRADGDRERQFNTDDKDYNRALQASVGFRF